MDVRFTSPALAHRANGAPAFAMIPGEATAARPFAALPAPPTDLNAVPALEDAA